MNSALLTLVGPLFLLLQPEVIKAVSEFIDVLKWLSVHSCLITASRGGILFSVSLFAVPGKMHSLSSPGHGKLMSVQTDTTLRFPLIESDFYLPR